MSSRPEEPKRSELTDEEAERRRGRSHELKLKIVETAGKILGKLLDRI
ncbi:hypothetical protein [Streptomyces sp. NPDC058457]